VQALEVTEARPEGSIGPDPRLPTSWRKFNLQIARKHVRAVHRSQTTFHFEITDCKGKFVSAQDLYVNNVSLNTLSGMTDAEFDVLDKALDDPAQAFFYVEDADFTQQNQLCGQFTGGSYLGVKIYNKEFRIK
jgi:hypothetical protein